MVITEAQLAGRAATEQAIGHLKEATAVLRTVADIGDGVLIEIIDGLEMDIETLGEVYDETFIDADEDDDEGD